MSYVLNKIEEKKLGRLGLLKTSDFFTILDQAYANGGQRVLQDALRRAGIDDLPFLDEAHSVIIDAVDGSDLFKVKCKCKLTFTMTIEN